MAREQINTIEYDLNVFYQDLGTNEKTRENEWADVYTIQPSVYVIFNDTWDSTRMYMESFELDLAETRAIAPDFPMQEWGDDFFITLEYFLSTCKTLPDSVKAKLDALPPIDSYLDSEGIDPSGPEIKWLN